MKRGVYTPFFLATDKNDMVYRVHMEPQMISVACFTSLATICFFRMGLTHTPNFIETFKMISLSSHWNAHFMMTSLQNKSPFEHLIRCDRVEIEVNKL